MKPVSSRIIRVPARYYQQFDADYTLDVPAEGYGGWKVAELEIDLSRTAVVVMHAWHAHTYEQFPGWYRAVEYLPRSKHICDTVFPRLLGGVRAAGMKVFHVVGGGDYYRHLPGYQRTRELAGDSPPPLERIEPDPSLRRLQQFRAENVFVGKHNEPDVRRAFEHLRFAPEAEPQADEEIAEDGHQLFALCKHYGINHLIYAGFAINWCLLLSSGGMADMSQRGVMCSAFRQAVTAVENKETARNELCKQIALWRVALAFGFVFDVDEFLQCLPPAQAAISEG
ncbi:MAG: hypothetical protein HPY54_00655 [Chthonomonadetes bacterium]|nr:hypothetical protein [Chthonomonadetes bacterium]